MNVSNDKRRHGKDAKLALKYLRPSKRNGVGAAATRASASPEVVVRQQSSHHHNSGAVSAATTTTTSAIEKLPWKQLRGDICYEDLSYFSSTPQRTSPKVAPLSSSASFSTRNEPQQVWEGGSAFLSVENNQDNKRGWSDFHNKSKPDEDTFNGQTVWQQMDDAREEEKRALRFSRVVTTPPPPPDIAASATTQPAADNASTQKLEEEERRRSGNGTHKCSNIVFASVDEINKLWEAKEGNARSEQVAVTQEKEGDKRFQRHDSFSLCDLVDEKQVAVSSELRRTMLDEKRPSPAAETTGRAQMKLIHDDFSQPTVPAARVEAGATTLPLSAKQDDAAHEEDVLRVQRLLAQAKRHVGAHKKQQQADDDDSKQEGEPKEVVKPNVTAVPPVVVSPVSPGTALFNSNREAARQHHQQTNTNTSSSNSSNSVVRNIFEAGNFREEFYKIRLRHLHHTIASGVTSKTPADEEATRAESVRTLSSSLLASPAFGAKARLRRGPPQ